MSSLPTPGLHRLTDAEYFAIDLPSSSQTKVLSTGTNAHLAHERENPREDTDAFAVGAYVHALLLAPDTIDTAFVRMRPVDRRTKEGKAEHDAAMRRADTNGARIITDAQVTEAEAMAASVRSNPAAAALLNTLALREITIIGTVGGRPAKAKADGLIRLAGSSIVVDVKTAQSAAPGEFSRAAATFGYYHQAAWYSRLATQACGGCEDFIFIVVEKSAPYLCAVYRVPPVALEVADRRIDALAVRWWSVREGDRTGYSPEITDLEPPTWWLVPS